MGAVWFIVAWILGIIFFPFCILWSIIEGFVGHRPITGLKKADRKLLFLAIAFDKYGNVVCGEMLNRYFITAHSTHLFGNIEETISEVIGYNLLNGTLSPLGHALNSFLNIFEENHSLVAIGVVEKKPWRWWWNRKD